MCWFLELFANEQQDSVKFSLLSKLNNQCFLANALTKKTTIKTLYVYLMIEQKGMVDWMQRRDRIKLLFQTIIIII